MIRTHANLLACSPSSCVRFTVHSAVPPSDERFETLESTWLSPSADGVESALKLEKKITKVWATSSVDGTSFVRADEDRDAAAGSTSDVVKHGAGGMPSLLALSVYESFYSHHPLKLNANIIWITIVQVRIRVVSFEVQPQ
jgi:hypothetical protein